MRRSMFATLIASLALGALANDGVELSLKSKALLSAGAPRPSEALFAYARDPMPQLVMLEEVERRSGPSGSCEFSAKDLCYDLANGRVVYRAAREYMPKFEGLKAENVSVRANRVILKYSFR